MPSIKKAPKPQESQGWDIRIVPTDLISENDYNPNEFEAELFETLVKAVEAEGMNQPILVRPDPKDNDKFVVVDGANRLKAVRHLGHSEVPVVVVNYDENTAKIRTISYNAVRGKVVPIKLARVLVDLMKTYSPKEIAAMTGVQEDYQVTVSKLLSVPDFKGHNEVKLKPADVDRPTQITLSLSKDESGSYTTAMKRAMKLAGPGVVALVGNEVESFDKAMTASMGIAGVKLRNVALALVCQAFNAMTPEQQEVMVEEAHKSIYDKLATDAKSKASKKEATDKKVKAA